MRLIVLQVYGGRQPPRFRLSPSQFLPRSYFGSCRLNPRPTGGGQSREEGGEDRRRGRQQHSVPACEFLQLVSRRWRAGEDRVVRQVTVNIVGKTAGGLIAP